MLQKETDSQHRGFPIALHVIAQSLSIIISSRSARISGIRIKAEGKSTLTSWSSPRPRMEKIWQSKVDVEEPRNQSSRVHVYLYKVQANTQSSIHELSLVALPGSRAREYHSALAQVYRIYHSSPTTTVVDLVKFERLISGLERKVSSSRRQQLLEGLFSTPPRIE